MTDERPAHVVGIVGGAVAGSVAAEILALGGVTVVVFEQNDRPHGKIEDGLPRWHTKQRLFEYEKIHARLAHPTVHYVPRTKLGRDVAFEALARDWGFSALLLANGAWRDRPLEVPGIDAYLGKGLLYQNPFIHWFNHKNERGYHGPKVEVPPAPVVVGGGLASIDVVKVLQLELYERALAARGAFVDMYYLEHEGIPDTCRYYGIADPATLGVQDSLLIYRRRAEDMPLAQAPDGATPEQVAKVGATRRKILEKAREKFLFRFEEKTVARAPIVADGRLRGLVVATTKVEGKRADPIPGSDRELRTDLVVSSIGSVPEHLPGIALRGDSYAWKDEETGEYDGLPGVFGIGNVIRGKGNIRHSLLHGQEVAQHLLAEYLPKRPPLSPEARAAILERVKARQRAVGYDGDFKAWIARTTPPDLE